ncbi:MAG: translesion DNA synthesis-associated protein ImuA [Betaproteobacteria bacterium]|nr:translesion DNA synthesis-associated protein ImuA [Betaproteobacteria bacterium]MDH5210224.1 translesion DNA synthesis-associated protein ImuA [Betaproteobacteria bacterium]
MPVPTAALEAVLHRHPVWRGGGVARSPVRAEPSGHAGLDRELPGGGWPAGALTEILCASHGIGELQLVLPTLAALSRAEGRIAWLAPPHLPYAPALAAAGLCLEFLTVVRAPGRRDALWAAEQVLRAGACRALLMWLPQSGYGELRRLALAAEAGGAIAFLFRPSRAAQESSPAPLRLALEPDGGQLAVRVFKRRGAQLAAPLRIPIPRPVHAVGGAFLSPAASRSQAARPCLV